MALSGPLDLYCFGIHQNHSTVRMVLPLLLVLALCSTIQTGEASVSIRMGCALILTMGPFGTRRCKITGFASTIPTEL